jgi:fatty-acyl-CoA synthase
VHEPTLHASLDEVATQRPDVTFVFPGEGTETRLDALSEDSRRVAARLRDLGIVAGDRVGALCSNEPAFLVVLFALSRLGACMCPLPLPMTSSEGYLTRLRHVLVSAGIRDVVVSRRLSRIGSFVDSALDGRQISAAELLSAPRANAVPDEEDPGRDIVLQYTSGSTARPKGVRLTHSNVQACLAAIRTGLDLSPEDRSAIWLPLFHDMGLFGTLTSMLTGVPATVWQPSAFVKDPANWLRQFVDGRHTVSSLPSFGYDYLVRAVPAQQVADYDLRNWRAALNGAEPIAVDSVESFLAHFAPAGFAPQAMMPVYGLAEATLAATFPSLQRGARFDWVDRTRLAGDEVAVPVERSALGARGLVCVGRPVLGMSLRIAHPDTGAPLEDRHVGEVQLCGGSVMAGYVDDDGTEQQPFSPDGWLRTGDLGYLAEGELYITGRIKEMIVLRGTNFYPDDVESAVRTDPGVHRSRCVAFVVGAGAQEQMVLVAETDVTEDDERLALAGKLRALVQSAIGLDGLRVVLTPPQSIPRTSSGKLQRTAARSRFT